MSDKSNVSVLWELSAEFKSDIQHPLCSVLVSTTSRENSFLFNFYMFHQQILISAFSCGHQAVQTRDVKRSKTPLTTKTLKMSWYFFFFSTECCKAAIFGELMEANYVYKFSSLSLGSIFSTNISHLPICQ